MAEQLTAGQPINVTLRYSVEVVTSETIERAELTLALPFPVRVTADGQVCAGAAMNRSLSEACEYARASLRGAMASAAIPPR